MTILNRSILISIVLFAFIPLRAETIDIPLGVTVISAPEVRNMVENEGVLLVHTLSKIEYQMQHIPTSINIPVNEIEHSSKMPKYKDTPVIFYCNGFACPYSKRAAKKAVKMGYSRVYWFRGGILEWRKFQYGMEVDKSFRNIKIDRLSPEEFRKQALREVLILDVRPKWWRQSKEKSGVVVGTDMMIPLLRLDKNLHQIPRNQPVLVVDRLMRQAPHAAKYLKLKGFNIVGVLKGGTKRWVKEGYPVLKQADEPVMLGVNN